MAAEVPKGPIDDPSWRDRVLGGEGERAYREGVDTALLYAHQPGTLVLSPNRVDPESLGDRLDTTARLSDGELRVLVEQQRLQAEEVPRILRDFGADPSWVRKLSGVVTARVSQDDRDALLDGYIQYWRVAATGAIALCAVKARAENGRKGALPDFARANLDRLDAFWKRGQRGEPVEDLLTTALTAEAVARDRPEPDKPPSATAFIIGGVVAAVVVAGVAVAATAGSKRRG